MGFNEDTKGSIGDRPSITPQLKFLPETILIDEGPTKISKTNIGHAFVLNHPTNGKLGVALGIDGSQITLGSGGISTTTELAVVNQDNIFKEYFRTTDFVDTVNTTATVNTTTHTVTF